MTDVSIERCTPPQWQRFRDLRLRALADAPNAFWQTYAEESAHGEKVWRDRLADGSRVTLIAVRGGGDVGVTTVGSPTWDDDAEPGSYDLGGFWVAPQARRTPVARQLLDAAVAVAVDAGATSLSLWVIGDNPAAERLYARSGFERSERAGEMPGRPGTAVRQMVLRLAAAGGDQR